MTGQVPDVLLMDGKQVFLSDYLLKGAFADEQRMKETFVLRHSACWRRHVATFAISGDRLVLVGIEGEGKDGRPVGVVDLFGRPTVEADWVSGKVGGNFGERLPLQYWPLREYSVTFTFERGVLVGFETERNGVAAEEVSKPNEEAPRPSIFTKLRSLYRSRKSNTKNR